MNNYYLDVCHSERLADFSIAYHRQNARINVVKRRVAAATVTEVRGQPNAPDQKTHVAALADDLWIVTAEDCST